MMSIPAAIIYENVFPVKSHLLNLFKFGVKSVKQCVFTSLILMVGLLGSIPSICFSAKIVKDTAYLQIVLNSKS